MKMETINPKQEVTSTSTNEKYVIAKFTGLLFNKFIAKNECIERVIYSYNYTNKQQIKFVFNNGYKQVFYDIPTSGGLLNDFEIEKLMGGEKNEKTN